MAATVPSQLERGGDFGQLCTSIPHDAFVGGICTNTLTNTSDPNGQLTFFGTPVPNNRMTIFTPIDPTSTKVLPLFPFPTQGTNGFVATQTLSQTNDQFGLRLDQYLSAADTLESSLHVQQRSHNRSSVARRR